MARKKRKRIIKESKDDPEEELVQEPDADTQETPPEELEDTANTEEPIPEEGEPEVEEEPAGDEADPEAEATTPDGADPYGEVTEETETPEEEGPIDEILPEGDQPSEDIEEVVDEPLPEIDISEEPMPTPPVPELPEELAANGEVDGDGLGVDGGSEDAPVPEVLQVDIPEPSPETIERLEAIEKDLQEFDAGPAPQALIHPELIETLDQLSSLSQELAMSHQQLQQTREELLRRNDELRQFHGEIRDRSRDLRALTSFFGLLLELFYGSLLHSQQLHRLASTHCGISIAISELY